MHQRSLFMDICIYLPFGRQNANRDTEWEPATTISPLLEQGQAKARSRNSHFSGRNPRTCAFVHCVPGTVPGRGGDRGWTPGAQPRDAGVCCSLTHCTTTCAPTVHIFDSRKHKGKVANTKCPEAKLNKIAFYHEYSSGA